jgi:hypothetical protein
LRPQAYVVRELSVAAPASATGGGFGVELSTR